MAKGDYTGRRYWKVRERVCPCGKLMQVVVKGRLIKKNRENPSSEEVLGEWCHHCRKGNKISIQEHGKEKAISNLS